jgi:serine/tyrosine/threonine adenylyltransferase
MDHLVFDNRFTAELPGDPDPANRPRQVFAACWSPVAPTPVPAPRLLAWSPEVGALLGLGEEDARSERFARVFGGNELLPGMHPFAAAYGGHQFGVWAGQLGDGRAISLGEVVNAAGARWELQLKGAGPTPFARTADGRAVLRSSIREFLCSEAMHHLGIPTTRALSLVDTGASVMRDVMYDGNPAPEPGAIVCRVAPSFLRPGNFQLLASREEHELLERLVDFAIDRDFPHLAEAHGGTTPPEVAARRSAFFGEVCERTADLMVHWMRVGFVHGVMNTDNLSILGLTIDYGPYGFLDDFDPDWTPNTTDAGRRRYRYGNQPAVAQWNLARFAEALLPLFPDPEPLEAGLSRYVARYNDAYLAMAAAKFGLDGPGLDPAAEEARALASDAWGILHRGEIDFTLFFRALGALSEDAEGAAREVDGGRLPEPLHPVFYDEAKRAAVAPELQAWLGRWLEGLARAHPATPPVEVRRAMDRVNPWFVLRNWIAQEAIDLAEAGDPSRIPLLLEVLRRPYHAQPDHARFSARRPEWARNRVGCSMLSCSS